MPDHNIDPPLSAFVPGPGQQNSVASHLRLLQAERTGMKVVYISMAAAESDSSPIVAIPGIGIGRDRPGNPQSAEASA